MLPMRFFNEAYMNQNLISNILKSPTIKSLILSLDFFTLLCKNVHTLTRMK